MSGNQHTHLHADPDHDKHDHSLDHHHHNIDDETDILWHNHDDPDGFSPHTHAGGYDGRRDDGGPGFGSNIHPENP